MDIQVSQVPFLVLAGQLLIPPSQLLIPDMVRSFFAHARSMSEPCTSQERTISESRASQRDRVEGLDSKGGRTPGSHRSSTARSNILIKKMYICGEKSIGGQYVSEIIISKVYFNIE